MKRYIVILSVVALLCGLLTPFSASAAEGYVVFPQQNANVTGDELAISVSMPQGAVYATLFLDEEQISKVTRPDSGTAVVNMDLSAVSYGRHLLVCRMQYADYADEEGVAFFYSGSSTPAVSGVSYVYNKQIIALSSGQQSVHPYTNCIRVSFGASSDVSLFSAQQVSLYYFSFGTKVQLPAEVIVEEDTVSVYPSTNLTPDALHVIELPTVSGDTKKTEIYFNVDKKMWTDATLYKLYDFTDSSADFSIIRNGGTIEFDSQNGDGVMHLSAAADVASSSYIDVSDTTINQSKPYVIDMMLRPVSVEGSSYIGLFDSKTENGWSEGRMGARFTSEGKITMINSSGVTQTLGEWTPGQWYRYSAVYNPSAGTCEVYLNGEKLGNVAVKTYKTTIFRLDMSSQQDGAIDFYIDNLALYAADVPLADLTALYADSIMDSNEEAESYLGEASAFSVLGDYYYVNGKRGKYKDASEKPVIYNDSVYVPCGFMENLLGYRTVNQSGQISMGQKASFSGNEIYVSDGVSYVSAEKVAAAAGQKMTYDERGYFVFSDGDFPYLDSENFIEMFEPADVIYRYLQFDNPRGEEVYEKFKTSEVSGQHPRILYTAEDIAYIKAKAENDETWQEAIKTVESSAKYYGSLDDRFTADCSDASKQNQVTAFQSAIEYLATAYLLTENTTYADKAIAYMKTLCEWDSLGYSTSNLTTGHWAMGMAIGYDSLYNYMNSTAEGRENLALIKTAVKRLVLDDTVTYYKKEGTFYEPHWMKIRDNFSGVIGGGMMALTLAFADEADFYNGIVYLLENIMKTHEIAVSLYAPDGGYFEGIGYSDYMLGNLCIALEALYHCCGSDFGLGSAQGFADAGSFFVYLQGRNNLLNFHDNEASVLSTSLPCWFALRYGRTIDAQMMTEQMEFRGKKLSLRGLLYYSKANELYGAADTENVPLDKYFRITEAGSFRNSFADAEPTFVGFHGGRTNLTHDMLDLGEFVFESDGTAWAIDLGRDSYDLPKYFAEEGYRLYRKRPEGENCVVINPATDADTYYGQALNVSAKLSFFESSEKGAMAAYDLTQAYQRDVTSYQRGYYFGDNRNTLLVQDEIDLKTSSEVYWFMHTKADIEIVNNNKAILSLGEKKLYAEVYCSDPDFTLSVMDAKPLPTSPVVSGQNENDGVRKLAIHTAASEGRLIFAVKLVPVSEYFDAEPLSLQSIAEWTLPQGGIDYKTVVSDLVVNGDGSSLSACIQVPTGTEGIRLLIDGQQILAPSSEKGGKSKVDIDITKLFPGEHELMLEADAAGKTHKATARFLKKNIETNLLFRHAMSPSDSTWWGQSVYTADEKWRFDKIGVFERDTAFERKNNAYLLKPTSGNSTSAIQFLTLQPSENSISEGLYICEFDVLFTSLSGHFEFECQNSDSVWFLHTLKIFNEGKLSDTDGSAYNINEWYHVKLILDFVLCNYSIYVDDQPIFENQYEPKATGLSKCKMQYTQGEDTTGKVSMKNMVFYQRSDKDMIYICAEQDDTSLRATLNIPSALSCEDKVDLFVCAYADGKLISVVKEPRADGIEETTVSVSIPEDAEYIKVLALKTDGVQPLCPATYATVLP